MFELRSRRTALLGLGLISLVLATSWSSRMRGRYRKQRMLGDFHARWSEGRWEEAGEIATRARRELEASPKEEAEWTLRLARCRARGGDVDSFRALVDSRPRVLELDPELALFRARIALALSDRVEAQRLRELSRGRGMEPAWTLLEAEDLARRGLKLRAREMLESAQFRGAYEAERLRRLANLAATSSDKMRLLEAALEEDPRNLEARLERAYLAEDTGAWARALRDWQILEEDLGGELEDLGTHVADAYLRLGETDAALRVLSRGNEKNPFSIWKLWGLTQLMDLDFLDWLEPEDLGELPPSWAEVFQSSREGVVSEVDIQALPGARELSQAIWEVGLVVCLARLRRGDVEGALARTETLPVGTPGRQDILARRRSLWSKSREGLLDLSRALGRRGLRGGARLLGFEGAA